MTDKAADLLCNQALKKEKHVCAIFRSREEAREIIGEFVAQGCRNGHKTMFLLDPALADDALQNLGEHGVDVQEAAAAGTFDMKLWKDSYLKHGKFDCNKILDFIKESMTAARDDGHNCIWAAGDMNWAGKSPESSNALLAYEAQLNELKPQFEDDLWVCFYDASQFNGMVIADIIRAHPVVLMGKRIYENPYYAPPAELMKELADWELYRP